MKNKILFIFLLSFIFNVNAQNIKDCSLCSQKLITPEQMQNKSIDEIRLLTNEIYARNGYIFENPKFDEYFSEKKWYKPLKNNKDLQLNETERKNIKLFQERTQFLVQERKELINQLKLLKQLCSTNDISRMKNQFGLSPHKDSDDTDYLNDVLSKIDFDNINWYKNKGIYKVLIDNGFVITEYSIYIENNKITFTYNFMAHSEIIKGFDVFTDYYSENEFAYFWQFSYSKGKLKFNKLDIAG